MPEINIIADMKPDAPIDLLKVYLARLDKTEKSRALPSSAYQDPAKHVKFASEVADAQKKKRKK